MQRTTKRPTPKHMPQQKRQKSPAGRMRFTFANYIAKLNGNHTFKPGEDVGVRVMEGFMLSFRQATLVQKDASGNWSVVGESAKVPDTMIVRWPVAVKYMAISR